jgi:hypothetical protein
MRASTIKNGLTNTPAAEIENAFIELGFEDVLVEDYTTSSVETTRRPDLVNDIREWTKAGAKAGLYYALLKGDTMQSEEEARAVSDELLRKYVDDIDSNGIVPTLPLMMVLGRKA